MRPILVLLPLLSACHGDADDSAADSPAGSTFVETLSPDQLHLLMTALPSSNAEIHALSEVSMDLQERWSYTVKDGGAMGSWRFDDGSTVFGESRFPPNFQSAATLIDASGNTVWRYNEMFLLGIGFTHGVVATPAGDFIVLDTAGGRTVSFDADGNILWELNSYNGAIPNGISLHQKDDGTTLMALAERRRDDDETADKLIVYRLGERDALPAELWAVPMASDEGHGVIPHGPHFQDDGAILVCQSAAGRVAAFSEYGDELWTLPDASGPTRFAFPRDAVFLPDGTLLVVDGEDELLRISDPFGAFEIVGAYALPGIFSVEVLTCGADGGLPCLR